MATYKILVVDDSPFMRKIISDLIETDPLFQVIDTANNGREAAKKVVELKPDVVTMDVEMPEMNGLEALKIIMSQRPLPIIMLSGINEQGMRETIMALENGAFDFIRKPSVSNSQDIEEVGQQLRRQLHTAVHALERNRKRAEQKNMAADVAPSPYLQDSQELREEGQQPSTEPQAAPSEKKLLKRDADKRLDQGRPERFQVKPAPQTPNTNVRPSRPEVSTDKAAQDKRSVAPKPADTRPVSKPSFVTGTPAKKQPELPTKPVREEEPKRTKPVITPPVAPVFKKEIEKSVAPSSPPTATPALNRPAAVERNTAPWRQLVAVGCSTGGPRALKSLLENIPANFPAPIVIVQHMPPNFTRSLAQRLNSLSRITVVEAEQGMVLQAGTAYIAPGGYHMTVTRSQGSYRIQLSQEPPRNGHRPSVDTLFASIQPFTDLQRHAVLMTGMGSDGAREMKNLYDSGINSTIAENEDTCVVYGMPRSAVELGCVNHLLPLPEIAPKLIQIVK